MAGGQAPDLDALRTHLAERPPKWWLCDEIRIVDELPLGSTGTDARQHERLMRPLSALGNVTL